MASLVCTTRSRSITSRAEASAETPRRLRWMTHEGFPMPARFTITDSDTAARAAVERSRRGEGIAARGVDAEAAGTGTGGLAAVLGRARARLAAALADARTRSTRAETGRAPSADDFAVGVGEDSESRGTISSSSVPVAVAPTMPCVPCALGVP